MKSHTMELPRLITVGERNASGFGRFLRRLGSAGPVSLITGCHVKRIVQSKIEGSLSRSGIGFGWHLAGTNEGGSVRALERQVGRDGGDAVVGVGGGRAVDAAKIVAFTLKKPFVSVPTAASHDGISSPFVSIRGDKPHSIVASSPHGVFVDIDIIRRAPGRLLASGCGDLIANITAVRDWELGHRRTGEYYGRYSASLALMSADMILENSGPFAREGADPRIVVEALISAGVASCIAGSSRPCSGSEHLFSHALDRIAPGVGLHGEKCGIGAIMMSRLHGQDWKRIAGALRDVGAPTTAGEIGLTREQVVEALMAAQQLRPGRYTILREKEMTKRRASGLAEATGVV